MSVLKNAAASLKKGNFIVVYDSDGREGEADLIFCAKCASPRAVSIMREKAGGLLCLATSPEVAQKIGLPFMSDLLLSDERLAEIIYNKTKYGDKPAFSISINHRESKTGISDDDRSRTLTEFGKIVSMPKTAWRRSFVKAFRTPGHVNLLIGRGIENRRGHTEMALEIARIAGIPPAMALCEITGTRRQMTRDAAKKIARENGWVFLEGKDFFGE